MADPLFVKRYVELLKNKKVKAAGILVFEARNKKAHSPALDKLTKKHEAQF